MYPSGIGTSYHDPLTTTFRKNQSLNFHSGRPLLRDFKQESGHVHPLLNGTESANFRLGKGLQYTNGIVSFDGQDNRLGSAESGSRSIQGHTFPTSVGTPGGTRRTFEGFSGQTWSSRPNTAYPAYGRRNHPILQQRSRPTSAGMPNNPPKWLALDKQILTFEAYFKEAVDESAIENYRVRRCVIQYFLEDDSMRVLEPREENSGIPQGAFLKRHRVPKGDGSGFFTWRDLDVGMDVNFYGRSFHIVNCDSRTREFYDLKGIGLSPAEAVPEDPMKIRSRPNTANVRKVERDEDGRRKVDDYKGFMEARLGKCQDDKEVIAQFLANDRKVLRFFGYWDDRGYGGDLERRLFRIHYFLADDTVEVLEVNTPNSGRDPWPALLKRMKLPKVYGSNPRDNRNFYKAADFVIGETVSVYGRKILLYDCDAFTREYYREQGLEQGTIPLPQTRPVEVVAPIPPHNGIGREEDSIMNVMSLHPKPPRQNVMRRLQNKSKMLRFVAKLQNAVGFDKERVFTVNYHLDTDDISIFEPPVRNSGRFGGKFMDKQKIKKPSSSEYYAEADLYVGARIYCFGRVFDLVDADLYTLNYMAANPHLFPNANPSAVKNKVAGLGPDILDRLEQKFRSQDVMGTGNVPADEFREAMHRVIPTLNTHEILTLQREFEVSENGNVSYGDMIQAIATWNDEPVGLAAAAATASMGSRPGTASTHNEDFDSVEGIIGSIRRQLRKRGPSGVRGLARAFAHADVSGDRLLGPRTLQETFGRAGVALTEQQTTNLIQLLDHSGNKIIDYAIILDAVCGEMPPLRENACRRAYAAIDRNNCNQVKFDEINGKYQASRHPAVMNRELTAEEARTELADCFEGAGMTTGGMIDLAEFLRIYSEISVAFEDDNLFLDYMAACWDIVPIRQYQRAWH